MFCMYKFISIAKSGGVILQHEQELRRRRGRTSIGAAGGGSVCVGGLGCGYFETRLLWFKRDLWWF
jgi:hypothetical protein